MLLLLPSGSYRAADFLAAAARLEAAVTVGCDRDLALARSAGQGMLRVAFRPLGEGVTQILAFASVHPIAAVVGADDETAELAAAAAAQLGLAHNDPHAVAVANDKHRFRRALARAGLPTPGFRVVDLARDRVPVAVRYPCVVKPLDGCASQGVIRADGPAELAAATARAAAILAADPRRQAAPRRLLVEDFIPGHEVAVDGLLEDGRLRPLAVFDKPDAPDGPFFEETLLLTPSSLPAAREREVLDHVERAARAIGLRHGPVHAEARVNAAGVWLLEIAARSIGGLCSRALRFGPGLSLDELVLRHALGRPIHNFALGPYASGAMMIPIPGAGRLVDVAGVAAARAVPGIEEVVISIARGERVVPLPEGERYLGFILARAPDRVAVERSLRTAHARLRFTLAP